MMPYAPAFVGVLSAKFFKLTYRFSGMPLFSVKSDRLERIKEIPFKSERKDIQKVIESSLKEVFGYEFIKSEGIGGTEIIK
jgi:hypothetical protein